METTGISADSELIADLGFDSVAFAVGIVAMEEQFGVHVPEERLFGCQTFGDLVALVTTTLAEKEPDTAAHAGATS